MSQSDDEASGLETVEEQIIPLVEEQLRLEKIIREGRTVTVRTWPVTETITVSQPVTREHVEVERVPIDQVVTSIPPVREDGDLTVIPVIEERVRVIVELVLREEIHLRRTREEVTWTADVERRRTEWDVNE